MLWAIEESSDGSSEPALFEGQRHQLGSRTPFQVLRQNHHQPLRIVVKSPEAKLVAEWMVVMALAFLAIFFFAGSFERAILGVETRAVGPS